jgi:hypothetical protein
VAAPGGKGLDELVQGVQEVVAGAADRIAAQVVQLQATGKANCDSSAAPTVAPSRLPGEPDPMRPQRGS